MRPPQTCSASFCLSISTRLFRGILGVGDLIDLHDKVFELVEAVIVYFIRKIIIIITAARESRQG